MPVTQIPVGRQPRRIRSSLPRCRHRMRRCRSSPRRESAAPAPEGHRQSGSCPRRRAARPGRTTHGRGRCAASSPAPPARAGGRVPSPRARAERAVRGRSAAVPRIQRQSARRRRSAHPTPRSFRAVEADLEAVSARAATTTTPEAWPIPHVQPANQPRRRSSSASGPTAARWSGPAST